eukprot:TRINITY_DN7973_c0_g1_i1.p1 TRINITY_DN7973_c0_g1~~TRINITY_DN7973_c0_g1_i1.p1  ORF type:complete len:340 (+),score=38.03 TRINITY_DN7973_c0_g1_i1:225-1244(+)
MARLLHLTFAIVASLFLVSSDARILPLQGISVMRPMAADSVAATISGGPHEKLCEACSMAVLQVHMYLSDPNTAADLIETVETYICSQLDAEKEPKCDDMVEQYVPLVVDQLKDEITLDKICVNTKICPAGPAAHLATTTSAATTTAIASSAVRSAVVRGLAAILGLDEEAAAAAAAGAAEGAAADDAGSAAVAAAAGDLEDNAVGVAGAAEAAAVEGREDCVACVLMVRVIRKKLSDPKVQQRLMDFFISRCNSLSNESQKVECTDAVKDILPVIFEELPALLDPRKVCKKAGMCTMAADAETDAGADSAAGGVEISEVVADGGAEVDLLLRLPSEGM